MLKAAGIPRPYQQGVDIVLSQVGTFNEKQREHRGRPNAATAVDMSMQSQEDDAIVRGLGDSMDAPMELDDVADELLIPCDH